MEEEEGGKVVVEQRRPRAALILPPTAAFLPLFLCDYVAHLFPRIHGAGKANGGTGVVRSREVFPLRSWVQIAVDARGEGEAFEFSILKLA